MLHSHECHSADCWWGAGCIRFLLLYSECLVSECLDCWSDLAVGWQLGYLFQGTSDIFHWLFADFWLHGSSVCHDGLFYNVTVS